MPNDTRDGRDPAAPVLRTWGVPVETRESPLEDAPVWLIGGGVSVLLWTALALLLTSA